MTCQIVIVEHHRPCSRSSTSSPFFDLRKKKTLQIAMKEQKQIGLNSGRHHINRWLTCKKKQLLLQSNMHNSDINLFSKTNELALTRYKYVRKYGN